MGAGWSLPPLRPVVARPGPEAGTRGLADRPRYAEQPPGRPTTWPSSPSWTPSSRPGPWRVGDRAEGIEGAWSPSRARARCGRPQAWRTALSPGGLRRRGLVPDWASPPSSTAGPSAPAGGSGHAEHTNEVLAELGLSESQIAGLRRLGVITAELRPGRWVALVSGPAPRGHERSRPPSVPDAQLPIWTWQWLLCCAPRCRSSSRVRNTDRDHDAT